MCTYVRHFMQHTHTHTHTQLVQCAVGWGGTVCTCRHIARVVASAFVLVPLPASAPVTGARPPVVVRWAGLPVVVRWACPFMGLPAAQCRHLPVISVISAWAATHQTMQCDSVLSLLATTLHKLCTHHVPLTSATDPHRVCHGDSVCFRLCGTHQTDGGPLLVARGNRNANVARGNLQSSPHALASSWKAHLWS